MTGWRRQDNNIVIAIVIALAGALGLGAAVAYFLDPARGRRRRAVAIDRATSAVHAALDTFDVTSGGVRNRLLGSVASLRSRLRPEDPLEGFRRDDVGRTGIWPVSGPLPPADVPIVGQGDLGTPPADRRAPDTFATTSALATDPVCGGHVDVGDAERCEYKGHAYYFDSVECRRQFDAMPERFATALDRRRSA
jgi:YHS domain-containing protein